MSNKNYTQKLNVKLILALLKNIVASKDFPFLQSWKTL